MNIEDKIRELEVELNKLKGKETDSKDKKVYYSVPVEGINLQGRKTITNILYTTDKFEPGEIKRRMFHINGTNKTATNSEYKSMIIDGSWFESPWEAKEAKQSQEEVEVTETAKKKKNKKDEIIGMLKADESQSQVAA